MKLDSSTRMADTFHMPSSRKNSATKVCSRCGKRRPVAEFGASDRYADGRRPHCLPCRVEMTRAWREANRDDFNEKKRAYESRADVRARRRARDRRRRRLAA